MEKKIKQYNCTGKSMYPVLKPGDRLDVVTLVNNRLRVGDVVVFPNTSEDRYVVHRVISIQNGKIRTRGDNNNSEDAFLLEIDDITGKVVSGHRGKKWLVVYGGKKGMIISLLCRILRIVNRMFRRTVSFVIRVCVKSNISKKMLLFLLKPKIINFKQENGIESRLYIYGRHVGSRPPGSKEWNVSNAIQPLVNGVFFKKVDR